MFFKVSAPEVSAKSLQDKKLTVLQKKRDALDKKKGAATLQRKTLQITVQRLSKLGCRDFTESVAGFYRDLTWTLDLLNCRYTTPDTRHQEDLWCRSAANGLKAPRENTTREGKENNRLGGGAPQRNGSLKPRLLQRKE